MNIALLGAGRIGQVHALNIQQHPALDLAVVVDTRRESAEAVAGPAGAEVVDDPADAVARDDIDAVMVCTSTDTHVQMIELCAAHKKPVFCEKPVDLDFARAEAGVAAAKKAGVPLMIGFNRRFDPHFDALKEALARGELGQLETLKIVSRDPTPPPADYVKVSGGIFRDMMIHDLDMARFLLGEEPTSVYAVGSCLVDEAIGQAGDVDTAMVVLTTKSGVLCHIENSRRAVYGYDQRVEAFGQQGMLRVENPRPTTLERSNDMVVATDRPPYFFLERYQEAYREELDHFVQALRGEHRPSPDGDDGLWALKLADACHRSQQTGQRVDVA